MLYVTKFTLMLDEYCIPFCLSGERPFKCDLCSRAFTTRGNLRTHYSSVHRQQLQNITSDHMGVRTNALQCPLCGSRFMDQQSFQQHMQMHIYMHQQQGMDGTIGTFKFMEGGESLRHVKVLNLIA